MPRLKPTQQVKPSETSTSCRSAVEGNGASLPSKSESDVHMRQVFDSIPALVFLKDTENRLITANQAFTTTYQNPIESLVGKEMGRIVGEDFGERCYESDLEVMNSKRARKYVVQGTDQQGRRLVYQCQKVPISNDAGIVEKILVIANDITIESELYEQRLAESRLFKTIFETTTDATLMFHVDEGRVMQANSAALRLFGCRSLTQFLDAWPHGFMPQFQPDGCESKARINKLISHAMEMGWHRFDWIFRRSDGVDFFSDTLLTRFEAGNQSYLLATIRDETEQRRSAVKLAELNEKLVKSSRQAGMSEITNGVLHNVKNVINSINVSASVICERVEGGNVSTLKKISQLIDEKQENIGEFLANDKRGKAFPEFLRKLVAVLENDQAELKRETTELLKSVDHVKQIISSQQSNARQMANIELIDVVELVEDAVKINESQLMDLKIRVTREFEEVGSIQIDRHMTLQILVNLMNNAKQAMQLDSDREKLMQLAIHGAPQWVQISVSDNGMGIRKDNLERIFEHGFTTKVDGHGFGLHSCKQAAERLGGKISVFSNGEGQGAKFTLTLPRNGPVELSGVHVH